MAEVEQEIATAFPDPPKPSELAELRNEGDHPVSSEDVKEAKYSGSDGSCSPVNPDDNHEPPSYDTQVVVREAHGTNQLADDVRHLSNTVDHISEKVDQLCEITSRVYTLQSPGVGNGATQAATVTPAVTSKKSADDSENGGVVNAAFDGNVDEGTGKSAFFQEDENEERGNWSGKLDFIMACLGYAVGLGNVWRFPYICYQNGGGAFFIPYVVMMIFVGLPIFFLELSLGQFSSSGPLTCYKFSPIFSGLGIGMVLAAGLVSLYYNVLISWAIYYLARSFTSKLPWDGCDPEWANWLCYDNLPDTPCNETVVNKNITNGVCYNITEPSDPVGMWNKTLAAENGIVRQTPSQQFFNNRLLNLTASESINDVGGLRWELCLCLLAAWTIVCLCLIKGIKSSGKVVYFTALFPYAVLITLFINGMLLEGMAEGITYYVTPKWELLLKAKVWNEAAVQIFFSLSTCFGGLITLSSYNRFHTNTLRDSLIVTFGNCATSVFAGFVIFAYLGHMAHKLGTTIDEVADGGVGLAFVVYPQSVLTMQVSPLWSILFFVMLLTLGLGSQFALTETVVTSLNDRFPKLRAKKSLVIVCVSITFFLIGLTMCTDGGVYVLTLFDSYSGSWGVLFIGICETLAISWVYGYRRFFNDIELMTGAKPSIWWLMCWGFITPAILAFVLVFAWVDFSPLKYDGKLMPEWVNVVGVGLVALVAIFTPIMTVVKVIRSPEGDTLLQKFRHVSRPKWNWGPALTKHRLLVTYVPGFITDITSPDVMNKHPDASYDIQSLHATDIKEAEDDVESAEMKVIHNNPAFDSKE